MNGSGVKGKNGGCKSNECHTFIVSSVNDAEVLPF
jgi:hypothetical protein